MQQLKTDHSLKERRAARELMHRLREEDLTFHELEEIGARLKLAGRTALAFLLRELRSEVKGELLSRYAYLLDFFQEEDWLDTLVAIALRRRDLGEEGKIALLSAL